MAFLLYGCQRQSYLRQRPILQVAPEDLVFGVFNVAEIIFLHGEDEHTHRGRRHQQAGEHRDPGQFHFGAVTNKFVLRVAACRASSAMVASRSTWATAAWALTQTSWAGHHS